MGDDVQGREIYKGKLTTVRLNAWHSDDGMESARMNPQVIVAQPEPARAVEHNVKDRLREWAQHWELWLALALGAFLRLWHLDLTSFLIDQSTSMRLARVAVVGHLIPVTSVEYSVGGYAPPFGLYLVLPFAAFTRDPLPVVVSIALWNVLGVALCYVFALKYFGRVVAGFSALLFATCGVAVNYSRFIWQPNYEATFLVLWALALYAWCIGCKTRWFVVSVVLLVLLVEITPFAVLLGIITGMAWFIVPRRPGRQAYTVLAGVLLVLAAPTLLWEVVTGGLDFRLLAHASSQHATVSLDILHVLYNALGASSAGDFGPTSLYAQFGGWYPVIHLLAALFFGAGYLIVSWHVCVPVARAWRAQAASGASVAGLRDRLVASWQAVRADREWCVHTLLWLWITLPPLSMLRYTTVPAVHYMLLAYPAVFVTAAYPIRWLTEVDLVAWFTGRSAGGNRGARLPLGLGVALVCLLIAAQTVQSALYPASLVSQGFDAYHFYGYPLAEVQSAEASISALQRQQHASAVYFSLPVADRYRLGMDYLLVGEHDDRIGYADNCLVLPPASMPPALLISTSPGSATDALLPTLVTAQQVADVNMIGGAPFRVYRVGGVVPALPGETAVTPAIFQASAHNALRLDAAAYVAPDVLRLRWTVLSAAAAGVVPVDYHIQARAAGEATAVKPGGVDCQPTHWQTGQTIFTWLSVSHSATPSGAAIGVVSAAPPAVDISVSASAPELYTPQVGPLHLLSGRYINNTATLVRPLAVPGSLARSALGNIGPNGSYELPLVGVPGS
jgi:hypothetical protein